MTIDIISNKADFQRHLNGCERRLNDLTKSLQTIEKSSQKLLLNNTIQEQNIYFKQLNDLILEIDFLYSSITKLEQSSFALHGKKRLDLLKNTLKTNKTKFKHIKQYSRTKFGYEYEQQSTYDDEQQEQQMKLLDSHNENIELDLINQQTALVNNLEKDIIDLQGTFIDINRIINEQGLIIENIEEALTDTDVKVDEAAKNIQTTVNGKKRSTRLKWILIISLICAILSVIIILYFTLKLAYPFG